VKNTLGHVFFDGGEPGKKEALKVSLPVVFAVEVAVGLWKVLGKCSGSGSCWVLGALCSARLWYELSWKIGAEGLKEQSQVCHGGNKRLNRVLGNAS